MNNNNELFQKLYLCFNSFNKNLANKKIIFIYENTPKILEFEEVFFPTSCFLHLTGLVAYDNNGIKYNSYKFYKDLRNGSINKHNIIRKDNTTDLKFDVLLKLTNIDQTANLIGQYDYKTQVMLGQNFHTYILAGGVNFCMGFIRDRKLLIPNSVLKQNIKYISYNTHKIVCIMKREINSKFYSEITHLKKEYDLGNLFSHSSLINLVDLSSLTSCNVRISNAITEYQRHLQS